MNRMIKESTAATATPTPIPIAPALGRPLDEVSVGVGSGGGVETALWAVLDGVLIEAGLDTAAFVILNR